MKTFFYLIISLLLFSSCFQEKDEAKHSHQNQKTPADTVTDIWELAPSIHGIRWNIKQPHTDHLEFSGLQVSAIVRYGVDTNGCLVSKKKVVWPMLRTIPNDTHASLIHDFDETQNAGIFAEGDSIVEKPYRITFNGILNIYSRTPEMEIQRTISPSPDLPAVVEKVTLKNITGEPVKVAVKNTDYTFITPEEKGVYGSYTIRAYSDAEGDITLKPQEEYSFNQIYVATKEGQNFTVDAQKEIEKREAFLEQMQKTLILETPDPNLNQMFLFAKIRAAESIFATKGGLMHGPGGSRYYAAIWANDQAEYVNPFFPFLGYDKGNESALNSFRHFARFMNDEYKPIPSSIIAEGDDIWNGAGDRGDAAMIAYGASRFALAYGDKKTADSLLPLIKWCIEYSEKQMTDDGIIASDTDELEGRFPAGKANLSTNVLAYGAYISAANLLDALNKEPQTANEYRQKAALLRKNIEKYFGANVQGFDTYRYYEGNDKLRSWICIPLTMDIFERKEATLKALLSDKLWTENGILTEAGSKTFWDRATLYAFRGIFKAGETDTGIHYLQYYTRKRLLGEHVPYAVEAWPEGNQRHLSAESGLYARVITEGLFGIVPTGFKSFTTTPKLPAKWDYMKLSHIKAFQSDFDIEVEREKDGYRLIINNRGKKVLDQHWNGKTPVKVQL